MWDTTNQIKNSLEVITNRLDCIENRILALEDRTSAIEDRPCDREYTEVNMREKKLYKMSRIYNNSGTTLKDQTWESLG